MQTYGIEKHGILNPKKVERNLSPAVQIGRAHV